MKHVLVLISVLTVSHVQAEVYKWTDEKGKTHFSSSPPFQGAKPAALPQITKEKFKTVPAVASCAKHGGIDCQKGEDGDGSVICSDGFKGAAARFRFSCKSAKLEITDVSLTAPDGSFTVSVRNTSSLAAQGMKVILRSVEGTEIPGEGPQQIEPLALGEYRFQTSLPAGQKAAFENFRTTCINCD